MLYMQRVKKPNNMAPAEFIEHMLALFRYSVYLTLEDSNEPDPGPDVQQRQMIVSTFPDAWVENFRNAGLTLATTDIPAVVNYLQTQAARETSRKRPAKASQDSNRSSRRIGGDRNSQSSSNSHTGSRDYRQQQCGGRGGHGGRGSSRGSQGRGGRGNQRQGDRPHPDDDSSTKNIPAGATTLFLSQNRYASTVAGPLKLTQAVNLEQLSFPEFSRYLK